MTLRFLDWTWTWNWALGSVATFRVYGALWEQNAGSLLSQLTLCTPPSKDTAAHWCAVLAPEATQNFWSGEVVWRERKPVRDLMSEAKCGAWVGRRPSLSWEQDARAWALVRGLLMRMVPLCSGALGPGGLGC